MGTNTKNIILVLTRTKLLVVGAADHFLITLQEDLNRYIMPLIEKDVMI